MAFPGAAVQADVLVFDANSITENKLEDEVEGVECLMHIFDSKIDQVSIFSVNLMKLGRLHTTDDFGPVSSNVVSAWCTSIDHGPNWYKIVEIYMSPLPTINS